ncbi:MAG: hypothetical protein KBH06_04225 [Spirochaetes bacterium]|nr:hypothetical protein [Spirochaetota bacterium]MBP9022392.1 hypothetical protein [Spirochaetota bacterium]
MNKFNRIISKYLLFSFPAVIGIVIWGNLQSQAEIAGFLPAVILREFLSLNIILWFIMLTYFVIALVISSELRNAFIIKVLRIKERDERESYITANAARFTFFSTLAVMICLLFFSIIDVSLTKVPEEKQINGKKHEISLGFKCELFDQKSQPDEKTVSIRSVPFSKETILMFLIVIHSASFFFHSKRNRI